MITVWDLNPIVLCHTNRFFQAASLVMQTWSDADEEMLGSLLNLWGNMLWAGSSFKAANRREEKAMAYSGAFVSSVAERAVKELIGGGGGALEALALLERQVHLSHDAILASLARDLGEDGLDEASPARLNAAVWKRLFPHFPSGLSQAELCVEMRERICGGMAA